MPSNGESSANADKLSGIEEESDMYEAFAPHVDTSQISVLTDSPAGKVYLNFYYFYLKMTFLQLIFCFFLFFSLFFDHKRLKSDIQISNSSQIEYEYVKPKRFFFIIYIGFGILHANNDLLVFTPFSLINNNNFISDLFFVCRLPLITLLQVYGFEV